MGYAELAESKQDLQSKLNDLRSELDTLLAREYAVGTNNAAAFQQWQTSHHPFHWFVEFHGIIHQGGFDAVIGNPPYVRTNKVLESYKLKELVTAKCPDIYAAVVERSVSICRKNGRTGMIVPLSITFSSQLTHCATICYEECGSIWFSSFGRIPSALFSFDTRVRNTIYIGQKSSATPQQCFTSGCTVGTMSKDRLCSTTSNTPHFHLIRLGNWYPKSATSDYSKPLNRCS